MVLLLLGMGTCEEWLLADRFCIVSFGPAVWPPPP